MLLRADRLSQSVWSAVIVSSACACACVCVHALWHTQIGLLLATATVVSTAMGMGQRDHGGLSLHLLGLGDWEGGNPVSPSRPKGASFLTSFNNHHNVCQLSCFSNAGLRITAPLNLGEIPGDHPGQAPCSKQGQLGQVGIASMMLAAAGPKAWGAEQL